MIRVVSDVSDWGYHAVIKPLLFSIHPDHIHENFLNAGEVLGRVPLITGFFRAAWNYQDPRLEQTVAGMTVPVPLGIAAGYDYLGKTSTITDALGIGWHTVGTITAGAYGGNKPPLYGRLKKSKSLWVNKGFKSPGAQALKEVLDSLAPQIPVGASIGATNKHYDTLEELVAEYVTAFEILKDPASVSYYEVNISCPNLHTKISLYDPAVLRQLLAAIESLKIKKPIFIKMPVDITDDHCRELLDVIRDFSITGIIIGNLTKKRDNPRIWRTEAQQFPSHGGLSGKPTQALSDRLIRVAYRHAGKDLVIVGCGGIFTAEDAYRKMRLGATLLQFVTGMIYGGPQVIGRIHLGMAELLERDGFGHISEVIGIDA
ncbi:quinone-dependent dihydroorotate dehydrogenase [Candidatus Woesebacteria bacterium]|nr:quinone-dependent dihydroorotate dehydrogenase [Candidatus Woesebacteria bacterium]MCD8506813.1 quinone-dependent dihydroorotate dehydrogenase [Candidatus Woesebacteria bacterium]MCD8527569.1 quinone-dependent dihydroorotate dehydrogenase [Candidatus Woesebacteria bacterium]MCD8546309.1 quinone-dependent dihydroorotate dehydrogenase [Candidatus Woesebacteria bacterium]